MQTKNNGAQNVERKKKNNTQTYDGNENSVMDTDIKNESFIFSNKNAFYNT